MTNVGGAEDDILHQVRHTADGGAILGGTSLSSISYDKTANITGGVAGYEDYWVVENGQKEPKLVTAFPS